MTTLNHKPNAIVLWNNSRHTSSLTLQQKAEEWKWGPGFYIIPSDDKSGGITARKLDQGMSAAAMGALLENEEVSACVEILPKFHPAPREYSNPRFRAMWAKSAS